LLLLTFFVFEFVIIVRYFSTGCCFDLIFLATIINTASCPSSSISPNSLANANGSLGILFSWLMIYPPIFRLSTFEFLDHFTAPYDGSSSQVLDDLFAAKGFRIPQGTFGHILDGNRPGCSGEGHTTQFLYSTRILPPLSPDNRKAASSTVIRFQPDNIAKLELKTTRKRIDHFLCDFRHCDPLSSFLPPKKTIL